MTVVICPGIHEHSLTAEFLQVIQSSLERSALTLRQNWHVFPAHQLPAYSALHLLQFLQQTLPPRTPLTLIGFSAGVVGAIATAWAWSAWGGEVRALIALDGWGVPLYGPFPIHCLSHDPFTHWSSQLLGGAQADSFYADPGVGHRDLWRSPDQVWGWHLQREAPTVTYWRPTQAAQVLVYLLERYGETTNLDSDVEHLEPLLGEH